MKYDIIIVGSDLTAATIAALNKDKKILILERGEIGGLHRTENYNGIDVHKYGANIFHTSSRFIWDFINSQSSVNIMNNYRHRVKAMTDGYIRSFPINLQTYSDLYNIDEPSIMEDSLDDPFYADNYEDYLIDKLGVDLYDKFYAHYSLKKWGIPPKLLPSFLAKEIPVRSSYNDEYYDDLYQGVPTFGYTSLIEDMTSHCDVQHTEFLADREYIEKMGKLIIYTDAIDEYFAYEHGQLPYRTAEYRMSFEPVKDFQGTAIMRYCDHSVQFTRIIEHKHFNHAESDVTITTTEYPRMYKVGSEYKRILPIPLGANEDLYSRYLDQSDEKVIFAGIIGSYSLMDLADCVSQGFNINDKYIR
jgi:UDP-galactopyranose mutase